MTCTHDAPVWRDGGTDYYTGEPLEPYVEHMPTTEDIDIGRYRCTQCGLVMYYTGTWRKHWEGEK